MTEFQGEIKSSGLRFPQTAANGIAFLREDGILLRETTAEASVQRTFLKDLAEAAGVSVSQASRALNGKAEVAPEVRQRVHELARKMNYRNLSHRHTVTLAVLINWVDGFTGSLFNELSREAEKKGIRLAVISPQHLSMLDEWLFDGVFSISGRILIPDWYERCRLPLVAVNSQGNLLDRIPGVFSDGGFAQAMEHLIGQGHRRIAVVNPGMDIPTRDGKSGEKAFRSIAEKWGIGGEACYFFYHEWPGLEIQLRRLLAEGCTALLDVSCENGPRLLNFFRSNGKRVPEDVSLITYDSSNVSAFLDPPLTTLTYDFPEMARSAIELMQQRLDGSSGLHSVRLLTKLAVRGSTGPAPRP